MAQATLQRELDTTEGHSLEQTKASYFEANTEWTHKTIKDYIACIDRFIVRASTQGITIVEANRINHFEWQLNKLIKAALSDAGLFIKKN